MSPARFQFSRPDTVLPLSLTVFRADPTILLAVLQEVLMSVMSIRIDDDKRKLIKALASLEGRTMTELVSALLDEYIAKRKALLAEAGRTEELRGLMRLSESSFGEWVNEDDDVYDRL
jgi:hypothetical protein